MAPHSSTLAWRIPWTEEPGPLQSMGELDTTERLHFHFSLSCTGEGNGNPLQCSCLENPRDGGAWWAAIYGVMQSQTRLKWLSSSSSSNLTSGLFLKVLIQTFWLKGRNSEVSPTRGNALHLFPHHVNPLISRHSGSKLSLVLGCSRSSLSWDRAEGRKEENRSGWWSPLDIEWVSQTQKLTEPGQLLLMSEAALERGYWQAREWILHVKWGVPTQCSQLWHAGGDSGFPEMIFWKKI